MSTAGLVVAQIGARRHYAVPLGLHAAGQLRGLFVDWSRYSAPGPLQQLLPRRLRTALGRRAPDLGGVPVHGVESTALVARWVRWRHPHEVFRHWLLQNRWFCRRVAARLPNDGSGVYVFNGAGLEILQAAQRGTPRYVDQTSAALAYDAALLAREFAAWPGWEAHNRYQGPWLQQMVEREEQEWQLAERIVCGSNFVATTLQARGVEAARCHVVHYPTPALPQRMAEPRPVRGSGPLRLLVAGTLQLRKGIQYLHVALQRLGSSALEVRVAGSSWLTAAATAGLQPRMQLLGQVPRERMAELYQWADLFVLPTLSEGSANVCYEAMSAGLPVLTTDAAGAPIESGRTGMLVAAADADALAAAIERLTGSPALRRELGQAGQHALQSASLEDYGRRICAAA